MSPNVAECDPQVGRGQMALLNLGEAHVTLGHVPPALHALNETVRCAQQCGDDATLAQVGDWSVVRTYPPLLRMIGPS
eukprot:4259977-Pyramimonas_sp.AAC.1